MVRCLKVCDRANTAHCGCIEPAVTGFDSSSAPVPAPRACTYVQLRRELEVKVGQLKRGGAGSKRGRAALQWSTMARGLLAGLACGFAAPLLGLNVFGGGGREQLPAPSRAHQRSGSGRPQAGAQTRLRQPPPQMENRRDSSGAVAGASSKAREPQAAGEGFGSGATSPPPLPASAAAAPSFTSLAL